MDLPAILDRYRSLDPVTHAGECAELLAAAAPLVDRAAEPRKWAALRFLYAQLVERDTPQEGLAAYEDALTVFTAADHLETWVECQGAVGLLLTRLHPPGGSEAERAIACLEHAVDSWPVYAELLATLYGHRLIGDPLDNWRRRRDLLERAAGHARAEGRSSTRVLNALAAVEAEEPGGDYAAGCERRLARLQHAAEGEPDPDGPDAIDTQLETATAYLDRVEGARSDNRRLAGEAIDRALIAAGRAGDRVREARGLLLAGRHRQFGEEAGAADLRGALALYAQAHACLDDLPQVELRASADKSTALALLALFRGGDATALDPLLSACDRAIAAFAPLPLQRDECRKLWQIKADALLAAGRHGDARDCLLRAIDLVEPAIDAATTVGGRLEHIWKLRDSAALAAWCELELDQPEAAITVLERGKARLWLRPDGAAPATPPETLAAMVPAGGAVLMAAFVGTRAAVIVVTGGAETPTLDVVWLPHLDGAIVQTLVRGPSPQELGGWLAAYAFRRSQPARWRDQVDGVGAALYDALWAPLLPVLERRGLRDGAPLVWIPDGPVGVLPVHAAWTSAESERRWIVDSFAIRYGPSLSAVAVTPARAAGPLAAFVDPGGDLPAAQLEGAWLSRVYPELQVATGVDADRTAVTAGFAGARLVHFAGHGRFDLEDPLRSELLLSAGEALRLDQILDAVAATPPDLVVLSACQTAVPRVTSLANELLGFPAALLAHGVRTVVASSWDVDDAAAALLLGEFYRQLVVSNAATALRQAQIWLRTRTAEQLFALLGDLRAEAPPVRRAAATLRRDLRGLAPGTRPFAHPAYWAAFSLWGQDVAAWPSTAA